MDADRKALPADFEFRLEVNIVRRVVHRGKWSDTRLVPRELYAPLSHKGIDCSLRALLKWPHRGSLTAIRPAQRVQRSDEPSEPRRELSAAPFDAAAGVGSAGCLESGSQSLTSRRTGVW